jgi:diguanylate cyclase (GGDEF)-like protein
MAEIRESLPTKEPQKFKVQHPERNSGESSEDYFTRAIAENIKGVLEKNKIQITPEIEDDIKEVSSEFGEDLGEKTENSIVDPLTGLYNRRHFEEVGKDRMAESKRYKIPLFFGYIDLDNFKPFNDEYGHDAGDNLLQVFGELLKNNLKREEDICARLGGDEFGFIIFGSDLPEIELLVENLRKDLQIFNEQFPALNKPLGFSVGVENWDGMKNIKQIMNTADQKLYKEKKEKHG